MSKLTICINLLRGGALMEIASTKAQRGFEPEINTCEYGVWMAGNRILLVFPVRKHQEYHWHL